MATNLNRILLVDDEQDILLVARHALSALGGFTVVTCESGAEALEQAPVFRPDLIVTDVMMPVMNGMETMSALRDLAEIREIPFVFMTARVQQDELEEYKRHGAQAVIKKPFNAITLHEDVLAIWTLYVERLTGAMDTREAPFSA
jgi:CheY-like chemotaxis protein